VVSISVLVGLLRSRRFSDRLTGAQTEQTITIFYLISLMKGIKNEAIELKAA
jgi:hypothetical protein